MNKITTMCFLTILSLTLFNCANHPNIIHVPQEPYKKNTCEQLTGFMTNARYELANVPNRQNSIRRSVADYILNLYSNPMFMSGIIMMTGEDINKSIDEGSGFTKLAQKQKRRGKEQDAAHQQEHVEKWKGIVKAIKTAQTEKGCKETTDIDRVIDVNRLIEEINTINKTLPKMIDDGTRFDVAYVKDEDVYFVYTLINFYTRDLDIHKFTLLMSAQLTPHACSTGFLDHVRILNYIYRDKIENIITEIQVSKENCE